MRGYAKLNLGLRVGPVGPNGLHPLTGLFQSISLFDTVALEPADEDGVVVTGGWAPADESNLAWRAVEAVRSRSDIRRSAQLAIDKRIPAESGLGGASADAAAALLQASRMYGVSFDDVRSIAPELGSDVPFSLVGGTAIVTGRGELVSPRPAAGGFAVALVVPPVDLATGRVYREWDALDGPRGHELGPAHLPPSLREYAPLVNDLYPAAVSLAPMVAEWADELAQRWRVPVAMTGSGSALFGLFPTLGEASGAVDDIPVGARFAEACEPVDRGWEDA